MIRTDKMSMLELALTLEAQECQTFTYVQKPYGCFLLAGVMP